MPAPTYEEMLATALQELADAQSVASFSKDGVTVSKQRIADLQAHIDWLRKQIAMEAGSTNGTGSGFVSVRL